jgi:sugar phosphate isomerase/epimerase
MELKPIRHLWGVTQSWDVAFPEIRDEGYAGVETVLIPSQDEERFAQLRSRFNLDYIAMAFTSGDSVSEHVRSFEQQLRRAQALGARQLTCHGGLDAWSEADASAFYREVLAIERSSELTVAHETHRGRILFNPWVTRRLLEAHETLRLCCDFSHWVCVAERTNWDDAAGSILNLCASRCVHLHARVGYGEGPQVPDPSAPEYRGDLQAHLGWWERIWRAQAERGETFTTVTPEFGPPGYLHTLPHTNVPVADLSAVCRWMKGELTMRFVARGFGTAPMPAGALAGDDRGGDVVR